MRHGLSYRLARALIRPLVRLSTRREWSGTEHLPRDGAVILAVNHISFVDPLLVAFFVDEQGRAPRFLTRSELFSKPVVGRILRDSGQIPVRRATAAAARATDDAVAALRRGECVVLYPEGSLTRDPGLWPMRGRTGVARMALASGAPVLPVAQWGIQRVLPPWSKRLRPLPPRRVRIDVGPPVELSDLAGRAVTADLLDQATARIVDAIVERVAALRGESPPQTRFDPRTMGRGAGPELPGPARDPSPDPTDERQPPPMHPTKPDEADA